MNKLYVYLHRANSTALRELAGQWHFPGSLHAYGRTKRNHRVLGSIVLFYEMLCRKVFLMQHPTFPRNIDPPVEHYEIQLEESGRSLRYDSSFLVSGMGNQTPPIYATIRGAIVIKKGWCTTRHSDSLHEHVTVTSPRPQRVIIFCTGAGNKPPNPEMFPDSIIFCITGGKSFALTGTRGDGDEDQRNTICETDSALTNLLKDFWHDLNQSDAFINELISNFGSLITVQPPAAHLRPPCRHVVAQIHQQFTTFFCVGE